MAPSRPIPVSSPANGDRRGSFAGLVSSLGASFVNPSPLAHEAVLRDVASLDDSELEADERAERAERAAHGGGGAATSDDDYEYNYASGSDSDSPGDGAPDLYRRPSGIAYGTSRPAVGLLAPIVGPPLSRLERKQSRDAERSLLRDNHLLPPKHAMPATSISGGAAAGGAAGGAAGNAAAGADSGSTLAQKSLLTRLYKRVFSTKVPLKTADAERQPVAVAAVDGPTTPLFSSLSWSAAAAAGGGSEAPPPDERTALLSSTPAAVAAAVAPVAPVAPGEPVTHRQLDEQWEAAVAAGQIHTTWQREAKTIAVYSRSLIITFLLQYSINITSIFAVGHIGKVELGAVSLASMTASITFYSPVQGLATCLDTLCAQAYGSGHKTLVGLQLQRMCCFLVLLIVPLECLWLNAEGVLEALIPDRETAVLAGRYLRVLAYSMPASAVFECAKRYMMAQGLFMANTYVLLIAAPLNVLLNWFLVWHLELGFIGAPISSAITQWLMPTLLLLYVLFIDGSQCWGGFSKRVFSNWGPMVRLALPGMIMIEAEYFAFEVLTLASGQFGTTELAAQSILVTITSTTYQIPFPMSIAASTRIANLIGAKLPEAAKTCARVAVVAGVLIGLFNVALVSGFRYQIPGLFTNDPDVTDVVALAIPVCAFMQVFDGLSAVANGLLRGVGRQEIGGYASLAAYYLIGLPLSFYLAFYRDWKLPGLWAGVTLGLALVSLAEYRYLYSYNWQHAVEEAEERNASG